MDVGVGHIETGDNKARTWGVESLDNCLPDFLGHLAEASPKLRIKIGPAIHFLYGHHEDVAISEGLDGKEGHHVFAAVDESAREFTCDDLAKYAHVYPG